MVKITLACAGGMSTSMLMKKMEEAAAEKGIDLVISASAVTEINEYMPTDIILLGPQISYQKNKVEKEYPNIPVDVIDMSDYGMMNGKKVLEKALEEIEKSKE